MTASRMLLKKKLSCSSKPKVSILGIGRLIRCMALEFKDSQAAGFTLATGTKTNGTAAANSCLNKALSIADSLKMTSERATATISGLIIDGTKDGGI
jgi:hypothetical protein